LSPVPDGFDDGGGGGDDDDDDESDLLFRFAVVVGGFNILPFLFARR